MNYKRISLTAEGVKGLEVHWLEPNNIGVMELNKRYPRMPIHLGLQKRFKDLRIHALNLNGYIHEGMDDKLITQHVIETTIDSIYLDGATIQLVGSKMATSDKEVILETYKVEAEDGYEAYDDLFGIIGAICEEVTEYMKGSKKADDIEAAMQWVAMKGSVTVKEDGKTKKLTIDDIKEFSPERLKEWASKLLENDFGSVVLHANDIDLSVIETAGTIEELKTEFEITNETTEIEVGEVKEKKPKKEKKELAVTEPSSPSDNKEGEEF